jgi:uncharacterized protein with HEPN domain
MRSDPDSLADILDAVEAIQKFVAGSSRDSFLVDDLVQSAVLAKLMIVGEAVTNLSDAIRDRHPDVPWAKIRGMRNLVIHTYHRIDWSVVWNAATINAPELAREVKIILQKEFPNTHSKHQ